MALFRANTSYTKIQTNNTVAFLYLSYFRNLSYVFSYIVFKNYIIEKIKILQIIYHIQFKFMVEETWLY